MTTLPTFEAGQILPAQKLTDLASIAAEALTKANAAAPAGTVSRAGLKLLTNIAQAQSLACFGDSHTEGYAASQTAFNYVSLLGAALGVTPVNYGLGGAQAADATRIAYTNYNPQTAGSPLATVMIGTNDSYQYNVLTGKSAAFQAMHLALVAYLACPVKTKGQEAGITYAGVWAASAKNGGFIGKETSANLATATFTGYGPVVYVAAGMVNGDAGTFDILVDGVVWGSFTTAPPSGATITTILGQTYGSQLCRIYGLTETQHTIQVKKTNASGTVTVDWVASAAGQNRAEGVNVIVGGFPRGNIQDTNAPIYLNLIKNNVQQLAGDGLPVTYTDVAGFIVPATDLIGDGVHTNDTGMGHIRDAFMAAINSNARGGLWRSTPLKQLPDGYGDAVVRGSNMTVYPGTIGPFIGGGDNHQIGGVFNSIIGGRFNNATGYFCTLGGYGNFATGTYGAVFGSAASDRGQVGVDAFASGSAANPGDSQAAKRVMRAATTDATVTRLTQDAAAAGAANTANLPDSSVYHARFSVVARQTAGAAGTVGDTAMWEGIILLKRGVGVATTTFVNGKRDSSVTAAAAIVAGTAFAPALNDAGAAAWRVTVNVDTTNGGLSLAVTGEASKTIRWVARIETVELTP
jgi:lysophospholipase L1-like esterase